MDSLSDYFYYIKNQIFSMALIDYIDIILVVLIFYYTYKFVRERRAGKLLLGVVFLFVLMQIADILGMKALSFILSNLFSVGLVAIIVVFQPELRSALEKVGGESLRGFRGRMDSTVSQGIKGCISEICVSCEYFSQIKTGALIVFERYTKLGDYIRTGTIVDANVSSFLINNIFFNKAPLHDGAVIIRNNRIHSAGCFLPLSTNNDIIKELGTRHRAGIGISENSDAVVLMVSEETGIISVAMNGELKRGFTKSSLESYLVKQLIETENKANIATKVKGKIFNLGSRKDEKGK